MKGGANLSLEQSNTFSKKLIKTGKSKNIADETIGFYSASTPITASSPKRFERAKLFLNSKGVHLVAGNLTGKQDGYRSGTIKDRVKELNDLIHDDSITIIMASIGGTNTNSVLPYIDYAYLNAHPKAIVGYSDATALLLAVKTKAPKCRVIYGPALVSSFGEFPPFVDQTWEYFEKVIGSASDDVVTLSAPSVWSEDKVNWELFERPKKQKDNTWHYINQAIIEGKIIGGNLNTMYGVIASPYFPQIEDGDILLIEDAEKDAATVEKNFAMLKNAGIFDKVGGIILGKYALFDDEGTGRQPIEILLEVLDDPNMPIVYDFDSCHTVPMMTIPLGSQIRINAKNMTVKLSDY